MKVLGKTKLNIADQNALLNQISNTYKDFYRAAMEYIDNAIDVVSINRAKGIYKDYKIDIKIDTYKKTISFKDNCGGMSPDELCNLLNNIGLSTKKAVPWANGQFGFGVHAFRAFSAKALFQSKKRKYPACMITIDRNKSERDEVDCVEIHGKDMLEEGTKVIISDFDKRIFKKNEMKRKLTDEISKHFDDVLRTGLIKIYISNDNKQKIEIKPFDYSSMSGLEYPRKTLDITYNNTHYKINIDLKILDKTQKDRFPVICNKGRRIQLISDLQSYKKFLTAKGKNNYVWGTNQFIVGRIELNDFCSPNITRDDLSNSEEREIFYENLLMIQEEIENLFQKKSESKKQEHLDEISSKLTNCLSSVMKNFKLTFEIQTSSQIVGEDEKQSQVDAEGSNWGGDLPGGGSPGVDINHGESGEKGVRDSSPGDSSSGAGDGGLGLTETDGKSTKVTVKSNAPKIEIKPFPDNKDRRTIDVGNTLYINTSHKDFKQRNSGTEDLPKFNDRLNNYISFVISPEIVFKLQKGKRLTEKELTDNIIKLSLKLEEHINKSDINL
jgi:hypothetical protein